MIDRSPNGAARGSKPSALRATGRIAVRSGTALTVVGGSLAWAASPAAAVEYDPGAFANVHTVTSTADDGAGSLRAALAAAGDGDLIVFELDSGAVIELAGTPLSVDAAVTIDAPDGAGITVDGNGLSGVFYIYPYLGDQVIIDSLTVTGGVAEDGAGIETSAADLVLQDVTVTGNTATDDGGGIVVRSGELTLTGSTISGNTAEGNGGGLYVEPYSDYDVSGVTITDSEISDNTAASYPYYGIGGGAAIRGVYGDVTITGTTVSGNDAGFGGGLAISDISGAVTIADSTVSDNYAHKYNSNPSGIGGGIAVDGSGDVTISDSTISGNIAEFSGGGVFVKYTEDFRPRSAEVEAQALDVTYDPVDIIDTVISGNGAVVGAGVSAVEAEVRLISSEVSGNITEEGFGSFFGGGVALKYSDLDLIDSRVVGNTAFFGGGIAVKYGSNLATDNSTISQNTAKYGGGIALESGGRILAASEGEFEASAIVGATFTYLSQTTVVNNTAYVGGGVHVGANGFLAVVESTISGNSAESEFQEGPRDGSGGGIALVKYADMEMVNSTVSGNSASNSGGGIWVESANVDADIKYSTIADNAAVYGGGISVNELNINTVTLDHTIVGDNSGGDVEGPVDAYYSLIETSAAAVISGSNNILGEDPELGPLDDNGGPTETHLPFEDSPVIDAGVEDPDVDVDQRGEERPDGDAADIGSVEGSGTGAVVKVVATTSTAVEGGTHGVFTFTRTGPTDSVLTVGYAVSGTATEADDYEPLGTVTFAVGESTVTQQVVALADEVEDPGETVIVTLAPGSGYAVATPISDTVTILEQEPQEDPCTDADDAGFTDVSESNVHKEAIDCLKALGITEGGPQGLPADQYGPGLDVTRGQIASFLARLIETAGTDLPADASDAFADDDGSTHEDSINKLVEAGIIEGLPDGTFGVNDSVRRDQMASLLARTYAYISGAELPAGDDAFTDDDGNVHEAAINALAAAGVVQGTAVEGIYNPSGDVRRDQMASFLIRLAQLLASEGKFTGQVEGVPTD